MIKKLQFRVGGAAKREQLSGWLEALRFAFFLLRFGEILVNGEEMEEKKSGRSPTATKNIHNNRTFYAFKEKIASIYGTLRYYCTFGIYAPLAVCYALLSFQHDFRLLLLAIFPFTSHSFHQTEWKSMPAMDS